MISKRIRISMTAVSFAAAALLTAMPVYATEETITPTPTPTPIKKEGMFAGWFHKLVQKFSFNFKKENSPKYSFGDMKNPSGTPTVKPSGEAENRERLTDEERLTKLVANGKITEAQKTAILAELATLKATYGEDTLKNLTKDERAKKMQEMREALKTWAKTAGIELGFVMPEISGNDQDITKPNEKGDRQGKMNRPSGTPKSTSATEE